VKIRARGDKVNPCFQRLIGQTGKILPSRFSTTRIKTLLRISKLCTHFSAILASVRRKRSGLLRGDGTPKVGGATCEDEQYLKLVPGLKEQGFEIGFHNASYHTSTREQTTRGLELFRQLFGHDPYSIANHTGCRESIYWGSARVSGVRRLIHNTLNLRRNGNANLSQGHIEGSPLFWGDLCREKTKYVRNFVFGDVNTFKDCPVMPYHDPARPFVNYWFASSEGVNVNSFNVTVSEASQDRLAGEGGACIMYAHFASRFLQNGRLNSLFKILL
jgi:hypothetical protein